MKPYLDTQLRPSFSQIASDLFLEAIPRGLVGEDGLGNLPLLSIRLDMLLGGGMSWGRSKRWIWLGAYQKIVGQPVNIGWQSLMHDDGLEFEWKDGLARETSQQVGRAR